MVLATFTHYVRNLFGGGDKAEVPLEVARLGEKASISEAATTMTVDDAPVTKEVATALDGDEGEGHPPAEVSTDESGTESAGSPTSGSSSPSKRKRADGEMRSKEREQAESDEDSDDEKDFAPTSVPTDDSAANAPAKEASAAASAAVSTTVGDVSPAVSAKALQETAAGDSSGSSKRPRREDPSTSS